jgi:hypothetical protein
VVNNNLEAYYDAWDRFIDSWIVIKIREPSSVYQWRLQVITRIIWLVASGATELCNKPWIALSEFSIWTAGGDSYESRWKTWNVWWGGAFSDKTIRSLEWPLRYPWTLFVKVMVVERKITDWLVTDVLLSANHFHVIYFKKEAYILIYPTINFSFFSRTSRLSTEI